MELPALGKDYMKVDKVGSQRQERLPCLQWEFWNPAALEVVPCEQRRGDMGRSGNAGVAGEEGGSPLVMSLPLPRVSPEEGTQLVVGTLWGMGTESDSWW